MSSTRFSYVSLVVVLLVACTESRRYSDPSASNQVINVPKPKDMGKFTNCGDPKHDFSLQFSPTTIKVGTNMTVWLSITPATPMSSGTLSITLTVPGVPDPIYKQQLEFDCGDIDPYVHGVCPFKVGVTVQGTYNYTIPARAHTVDIPTGQYHVKGEIRNQFTDPFLCGETDVTIINPQMDN